MLEIKHLSYQVEDETGGELGILNDGQYAELIVRHYSAKG